MKISDGLQGLYKPDIFKHNETRLQLKETDQKNLQVLPDNKVNKPENVSLSVKKVLSSSEINSLTALFGYEQGGRSELYGNNKIGNVHAGMLLDVKG